MKTGPYEIKTDVQAVVVFYKTAIGLAPDDRLWDEGNFARAGKTAKALIEGLGSKEEAIASISGIKAWAESAGLTWTLETVLRRAAEWKAGRIKPDRAKQAPDPVEKAEVALKRIDDQAKGCERG